MVQFSKMKRKYSRTIFSNNQVSERAAELNEEKQNILRHKNQEKEKKSSTIKQAAVQNEARLLKSVETRWCLLFINTLFTQAFFCFHFTNHQTKN